MQNGTDSESGEEPAVAPRARRVVKRSSTVGLWQDPEALASNSAATVRIALGAVEEGEKLGIRHRSSRMRGEMDAEPTSCHKTLPELSLLLFSEAPSQSSSKDTWQSTQPPAFIDWAYRDSPWHWSSQKPRDQSSKSSVDTADRGQLSTMGRTGQLDAISEAPAPASKGAGASSATPTSMAGGSTRVTSKADMSRPPSCPPSVAGSTRVPSRASTRAASASPVEPTFAGVPRPPSCPPPGGSRYGRYATPENPTPDIAEISRTPSPTVPEVATDPPHLDVASLPLADQLGIAADASGARARGAVSMAIRMRAICRTATQAASRRLLHLHGERSYPPAHSVVKEEDDTDFCDYGERVRGSTHGRKSTKENATCAISGLTMGSLNFDALHSTDDDAIRKKRVIKVARNTPLGRMVVKDPERATKYDLVTVPTWTQNKPWPPPAVKAVKRKQSKANHEDVEEKKTGKQQESVRQKMQKNRKARLSLDGSRNNTTQIKAMIDVLSLRKSGPNEPKSPTAAAGGFESLDLSGSFRSESYQAVELRDYHILEMADVELAATFLDYSEKEAIQTIFTRFADPIRGVLSRTGMVKALQATGHTPSTRPEQQCFANVQGQVIQHTRPNDTNPDNNPVLNSGGVWKLSEFVLMVSALHEMDKRKVRLINKEWAEEFNMPVEEIDEMRIVFERFDEDGNGFISKGQLKELLQATDFKTTDQDFGMLLESVGIHHHQDQMVFKQFVQIAMQINKMIPVAQAFLLAPRGERNRTLKNSITTPSFSIPGRASIAGAQRRASVALQTRASVGPM